MTNHNGYNGTSPGASAAHMCNLVDRLRGMNPSEIRPETLRRMAALIRESPKKYNGVVVHVFDLLHGLVTNSVHGSDALRYIGELNSAGVAREESRAIGGDYAKSIGSDPQSMWGRCVGIHS